MKNLKLNYEGFDAYLVKRSEQHMLGETGVQYIFKFDNNFGASVIKHAGSYGWYNDLWELAVIIWRGDEWHLNYDTPITDDVLGYLTDACVRDFLGQIKGL